MATFYIPDGNSDGFQNSWYTWSESLHSNSLSIGKGSDNVISDICLRFSNVTIPQGATITSASITMQAYQSNSSAGYIKIKGIDEDNTSSFDSNPFARTATSATIDWDIGSVTANNTYTSSSITTIVQEIVNRGSWSSGNAMGFFLMDDGFATNVTYRFDAYEEGTGSTAAILTVTYGGSSPSASPSPSSSVSKSASASISPSSSVSASLSASPSPSASVSPSPEPVDYGIKIAKDGYSPEDGNNRLIFHSSYPLLKIMSSGSGTITLSSGEGSKTLYTHSLGYKPMFYVWVNYIDVQTGSEVEKLRMCSWKDYAGVQVWSKYHAYTTTTTLQLVIDSAYWVSDPDGPGNETLDYRYVIYYDGIN